VSDFTSLHVIIRGTDRKHQAIRKLLHRRYTYFDSVVGLAWSSAPESYARGSVATGRGSHAGQVKGDDPVLQVGGWA
jgi:hypothetical protein